MKKGSDPHYLFVNAEVVSQILAGNGIPAEHPQHAFYKDYILDKLKGTWFASSEEGEEAILSYIPKVTSLSMRKKAQPDPEDEDPELIKGLSDINKLSMPELKRFYDLERKGLLPDEFVDDVLSKLIYGIQQEIKRVSKNPRVEEPGFVTAMKSHVKQLERVYSKSLNDKIIMVDHLVQWMHIGQGLGVFQGDFVNIQDTLDSIGEQESLADYDSESEKDRILSDIVVRMEQLINEGYENKEAFSIVLEEFDIKESDFIVDIRSAIRDAGISFSQVSSLNMRKKAQPETPQENFYEPGISDEYPKGPKKPKRRFPFYNYPPDDQGNIINADPSYSNPMEYDTLPGAPPQGPGIFGKLNMRKKYAQVDFSYSQVTKQELKRLYVQEAKGIYDEELLDEIISKFIETFERLIEYYTLESEVYRNSVWEHLKENIPYMQKNIKDAKVFITLLEKVSTSTPQEKMIAIDQVIHTAHETGVYGEYLVKSTSGIPSFFEELSNLKISKLNMRKKADEIEERGISYILEELGKKEFELTDPTDIEIFVLDIGSHPPGFAFGPSIHDVNSIILENMEKFTHSFIENWKIYFAEEYGLKESFSKELAIQILGELLEVKPLTEQELKLTPFPEFIKKRPELTEETMKASPYAELLRKYTADEIFDIAAGRKEATEEEVALAKDVITRGIVANRLSMRKKAQIDKQMFFDFYGVSLLSDQYLEINPYAKKYKDTVVQQTKDVYVPLITKMCYSEFLKHTDKLYYAEGWQEKFDSKTPKDLSLEQLAQIYNEGEWKSEYGGKAWGGIVESLIQLKNTTDTNQLITIIDHINDIQHNTGLMFHDFPKVEKWFSDALEIKAQSTPEGLIPYLSTDLQKLVTEDLKLRGQEVVTPERYLSETEKGEIAENLNTSPETLAELAKNENADVRLNVAANPNTPPEALAELSKDKSEWIRYWVAGNPNTPPETLTELAKDKDEKVRWEVADNLNTPPEIKKRLGKQLYSNFNLNMRKKGKGLKEYIRENIERVFIIPQQLKLRFGKVAQAEFNIGEEITFDTTRYLGRGKKRVGGVLKGKGVITKKEDDTYSIEIIELTEVARDLKNIFRTGMTAEFALDEIKLEKPKVEPKKEIPVEELKPKEKIPTYELVKEPSKLPFEFEEEEILTYELVEGLEKPTEKPDEVEEKEEKPFWKELVEKAWESFRRPVTKPFGSKLYMKKIASVDEHEYREKEIHQGKVPIYTFVGFQEGLQGEKYILINCDICKSTLMLTAKEVKAYEYKIKDLPRGWEQEVKLASLKRAQLLPLEKSFINNFVKQFERVHDAEYVYSQLQDETFLLHLSLHLEDLGVSKTRSDLLAIEIYKQLIMDYQFFTSPSFDLLDSTEKEAKLNMRKKAVVAAGELKRIYTLEPLYRELEQKYNTGTLSEEESIQFSQTEKELDSLTEKVVRDLILFFEEYLGWYKKDPKIIREAEGEQKVVDNMKIRLNELSEAFDIDSKMVAIDNVINMMHVDFPIISHLAWEHEEDIEKWGENKDSDWEGLIEFLHDQGKLQEEVVFTFGSVRGDRIKLAAKKHKGPIKSILEDIAQDVWTATDLETAKNVIINKVENSKIDEDDKRTIIDTTNKIDNLVELQKYIANSILFYEGMGTKLSMRKKAQEIKIKLGEEFVNEFVQRFEEKHDARFIYEKLQDPNFLLYLAYGLEREGITDQSDELVLMIYNQLLKDLHLFTSPLFKEQLESTSKIKKAEVVVEGSPPGEGSWAMYQGNVYITYDKNKRHAIWFEEIGLPSAGVEYDNIVRGYFVDDRNYIGWYGMGDYNEFYDHLGELKTTLGYPEDSEVGMIDYTTQEIQVLSMRKKAQLTRQLFFDFYGVSLLPDNYEIKDIIIQQVRDVYIEELTKLVYELFPYKRDILEIDSYFYENSGVKTVKNLSLEQLYELYERIDPEFAEVVKVLIQLMNITDTNQSMVLIDRINDMEHMTGSIFSHYSKTGEWIAEVLDVKTNITPQQLIPYLSKDVRDAVIEHLRLTGQPISSEESVMSLSEKIELAKDPNTPPETLAELVKGKNYEVLQEVAVNLNTPVEVLTDLAKKVLTGNIELLGIMEIGEALLSNSNLPRTLRKKLKLKGITAYPKISQKYDIAENPSTPIETLTELAKDKDVNVRARVGKNPSTSPETLTELAKDKDGDVRRATALNTSILPETLAELAKDEDEYVRYNVAKNPNTPLKVKKQLKQEEIIERIDKKYSANRLSMRKKATVPVPLRMSLDYPHSWPQKKKKKKEEKKKVITNYETRLDELAGMGSWAIYNGKIYTTSVPRIHSLWFEELGLPSTGLEYDNIVRGTYGEEGVLWYQDTGSLREFYDYLPKLLEALGLSEDTPIITTSLDVPEFKRISIRKEADLKSSILSLLLVGTTIPGIADMIGVPQKQVEQTIQSHPEYFEEAEQPELPPLSEYIVNATVYNATPEQTSADPEFTADMTRIDPNNVPTAEGERIIALSRDLLKKFTPDAPFDYGDKILVEGAGEMDGLWVIHDTMNARFSNTIDFLVPKDITAGKWENVKINKVQQAETVLNMRKQSSLNIDLLRRLYIQQSKTPGLYDHDLLVEIQYDFLEAFRIWKEDLQKQQEDAQVLLDEYTGGKSRQFGGEDLENWMYSEDWAESKISKALELEEQVDNYRSMGESLDLLIPLLENAITNEQIMLAIDRGVNAIHYRLSESDPLILQLVSPQKVIEVKKLLDEIFNIPYYSPLHEEEQLEKELKQMKKDVEESKSLNMRKKATNVSVPTPSDSLHEQQGEQNLWHTYFQGKDRWISREPDQGFDIDFPSKERIKRSPWPFDDTTPTSQMMASLSMRKKARNKPDLRELIEEVRNEIAPELDFDYIVRVSKSESLTSNQLVGDLDMMNHSVYEFNPGFLDNRLPEFFIKGVIAHEFIHEMERRIEKKPLKKEDPWGIETEKDPWEFHSKVLKAYDLYSPALVFGMENPLMEEIFGFNMSWLAGEEDIDEGANKLSMRKKAQVSLETLKQFYTDMETEQYNEKRLQYILDEWSNVLDKLTNLYPNLVADEEFKEFKERILSHLTIDPSTSYEPYHLAMKVDGVIDFLHDGYPEFRYEFISGNKEEINNWFATSEEGRGKEASILDYPQKHLDSAIWDLSGDLPKLKENVKGLIVERFLNYLREEGKLNNPELWCVGFYYTGSTATYRYRPTTDIDIHVKVDWEKFKKSNPDKAKDVEEMHKELLQVFWNTLNKEVLPDTQHPLTYYVLSERENVFEMGEEAYDILNDSWIVPPHKLPENLDIDEKIELLGTQANAIMERLDEELGKTKRDFIDYKILKELLDSYEGDKKDIQKLIEKKLDDVESRLKGLQEENVKIHDERQKAFYDGQEPIEEGLSQNWAPGNIIFKLIEKYKYMDVLRKIKHIIEDDKITEDEEKQLEDILEPKLSMRKNVSYMVLWAIYNGKVYTEKTGVPEEHANWFYDIGLPYTGVEYDKVARGDYDPDEKLILWYDATGTFGEFFDQLPELVKQLGAPEDTIVSTDSGLNLDLKEVLLESKLSMRKKAISDMEVPENWMVKDKTDKSLRRTNPPRHDKNDSIVEHNIDPRIDMASLSMRKKAYTLKALFEGIEFTDRYDALGISLPNPETMCRGQCEGTGWIPIHKDDMEEPFHTLWLEAEKEAPTDDDWHFVKCPDCHGIGLRTNSKIAFIKIKPSKKGLRKLIQMKKKGFEGQPTDKNYNSPSLLLREDQGPSYPSEPAQAEIPGTADDDSWGESNKLKKKRPTKEKIFPDFQTTYKWPGGEVGQY